MLHCQRTRCHSKIHTRCQAKAQEDFRTKPKKDVRVLVAGSTGYIGKYVTKELINRGYDVVAFAREKSGVGGKTSKQQTEKVNTACALQLAAAITCIAILCILAAGLHWVAHMCHVLQTVAGVPTQGDCQHPCCMLCARLEQCGDWDLQVLVMGPNHSTPHAVPV